MSRFFSLLLALTLLIQPVEAKLAKRSVPPTEEVNEGRHTPRQVRVVDVVVPEENSRHYQACAILEMTVYGIVAIVGIYSLYRFVRALLNPPADYQWG